MEFFKNEYFILHEEDGNLLIQVAKAGFDVKEFSGIAGDYPNMQMTNFMNLKNALAEPNNMKIAIGVVKPRVDVMISASEMEAKIKLYITAKEFAEKTIGISSEIVDSLRAAGVTEGLDSIFTKPITVGKEILIANGILPVDGEDAKISYFAITDKKPIVKDDGKVNHYELNLIDRIREGEWLGEKINATDGIPGKTVTGKIIPAKRGKDAHLKFDKKTVTPQDEGNKTILRAACDGAVMIDAGKIRVDNLLVIGGDVGYETGNIEFDGYVTVEGTVKDGFSITAKNDIAINSTMGLGQVEKIESKEGSVLIKGGIYGKNKAQIIAKKNVYIKYTNEASIIAGEEINIGFYSLDSELIARNVVLDPIHGKIMGGKVSAQVQVVTGTIGSKAEKKTIVNVKGFDREEIKKQFENLLIKYKEILQEASKTKRYMEVFEQSIAGAEYSNMEEYNILHKNYEKALEEVAAMEDERKKLQKILETKGDGEIGILKTAFPETYLEIKEQSVKIDKTVSGSFYVENKELQHK